MSTHYDMRELMLSINTKVSVAADNVGTLSTVAYHTRNDDQHAHWAAMSIEALQTLRDRCNELLAQAEKAAVRRAA